MPATGAKQVARRNNSSASSTSLARVVQHAPHLLDPIKPLKVVCKKRKEVACCKG